MTHRLIDTSVLIKWFHSEGEGEAADQLDDLHTIFGPSLGMTADWLRHTAALARKHNLSYYDASWAATAIKACRWRYPRRRRGLAGCPVRCDTGFPM